MKEYVVRVERQPFVKVTVQAETEEEAIDKAYDRARDMVDEEPYYYDFDSAEVEDEYEL